MIEWCTLGSHFLSYFQDKRMRRCWKRFKCVLIRDKFSNIFPINAEISLMDWWAYHRVLLCEVSVPNQPSGGNTNRELAGGGWGRWGDLGVGSFIKEPSQLCVICRGRQSGNRTGCTGGFGSSQQISRTRGGFVSNCTALFELNVPVEVQIHT